jgi:hypothetical protein
VRLQAKKNRRIEADYQPCRSGGVNLLGGFVWSSQRPAPTGDETNQEKNQKNNKKDPGDLGRRPGYAGQAQKAGNQTDD